MGDIGSVPEHDADDPIVPKPTQRGRRRWDSIGLRVAVATLVAGGVAAGSYAIASAAANNGAVGPASKALATASRRSAPTKPWTPWAPSSGRPRFGGPRSFGPFGFGAMLAGGGTVTAVTPTTITVKTLFGGTFTFSTNSSTIYHEGGKTVARSAVSVGEQIALLPVFRPGAPGSGPSHAVAANVEIVQPHVVGKVVKVNGTQFVVSRQAGPFGPGGVGLGGVDGPQVTVNISTSTTYDQAGHPASVADINTGTLVAVTGTLSSSRGQIDATRIEIVPAAFSGR